MKDLDAIDRLLLNAIQHDAAQSLAELGAQAGLSATAVLERVRKLEEAGIIKGRILFSTPGSENAVRLAMEKLILPELGHLVKELTK